MWKCLSLSVVSLFPQLALTVSLSELPPLLFLLLSSSFFFFLLLSSSPFFASEKIMHGHGISNSGSDLKYEILKIREFAVVNGSNTQQSESFRLLLAKCIRRRKYTIPFLLNRGGVLLRLLFENLRTSIPWWPKIRTWNQDAYTSIEH